MCYNTLMNTKVNDQFEQWKRRPQTVSTPAEKIDAMLVHPLGSEVWSTPSLYGFISVEEYWTARQSRATRYSNNWPSRTEQLANVLIAGGIELNGVGDSIRKHAATTSCTVATQLHLYRLLQQHFNATLDYNSAFEGLNETMSDPKQEKNPFVSHISSTDKWTNLLHALVQYDSSEQAQHAYFEKIKDTFLDASVKKSEAIDDELLDGNRFYNRYPASDSYVYGWGSSGCIAVQALTKVDNSQLALWLHEQHDVHALAQMVLHDRLDFSKFLSMITNPSTSPTPPIADTYFHRDRTYLDIWKNRVTETIKVLCDEMNPNTLRQEGHLFAQNSQAEAEKLISLIPAPDEDNSIKSWWLWNQTLHSLKILHPQNASAEWLGTINHIAQERLTDVNYSSERFFYLSNEDLTDACSLFADSHPILANLTFAALVSSAGRADPADHWNKIKSCNFSWLSHVDVEPIVRNIFLDSTPSHLYRSILGLSAILLPQMNQESKAYMAPFVAYGMGLKSINGLAPSTLRSLWKEQCPEEYKASIPRVYTDDNYILFGITRKDPKPLMSTLESMDLREDRQAYLHSVSLWVREAMKLPSIMPILDFNSDMLNTG